MVGISKLYCRTVEPSDVLRYGRKSSALPSHMLQFSVDKKPVVVWNVTRRCNLKCIHCYSQSNNVKYEGELSREEGFKLIEDLAEFKVPVILFSGGEPLMREDIFELIDYSSKKGMRAVLSTNGTMISKNIAKKLKNYNVSYVGISLDGIENTNDIFRGRKGAFADALRGIHNCMEEGIKVGLRFTINKHNVNDIPEIFQLLYEENIPRICFYHLVYSGRGSDLINEDLSHEETRETVDLIVEKTSWLHSISRKVEVLTVDNHADGPYLYMKMLRERHGEADDVLTLLKMNGGNSSGIGIGCISWDGSVHPDQFWRHYSFGNVRERPFSQIWKDTSNPLMLKLKNRKAYLKGRCSYCKWLDICNGNFRARAEAVTGDIWAPDPACYLTDQEIS